MVTGSLKDTSDKAFPFYVGVSTRHFKGITGDFNRRRLSWWPEIPVSRFCVFTDWLKVDVHCFPHALIGWNNATAWKPSTFVLALFLHHFILICWCFFALSVFRATTFYSRWIMIQRIEVFIRTVSFIWTARPNMNSIYWFENRPMKLAWACIDLHVPFGHSLASRCKSTQVKLARTCVPFGQALKRQKAFDQFSSPHSSRKIQHPSAVTRPVAPTTHRLPSAVAILIFLRRETAVSAGYDHWYRFSVSSLLVSLQYYHWPTKLQCCLKTRYALARGFGSESSSMRTSVQVSRPWVLPPKPLQR